MSVIYNSVDMSKEESEIQENNVGDNIENQSGHSSSDESGGHAVRKSRSKEHTAVVVNIGQRVQDVTPESVAGSSRYIHSTTLRDKLFNILNGHTFQVIVIALVVVDICIVIATLLVDLQILIVPDSHLEITYEVLHYTGLAILCLFVLEVMVKIYALQWKFFHHWWELFDAVVIIISFALDLAYHPGSNMEGNGFGLIIVLRLWRVVRVVNGIIVSSTSSLHAQLEEEKEARKTIERDLESWKTRYELLEKELDRIKRELRHRVGHSSPTPSFFEKHNTADDNFGLP